MVYEVTIKCPAPPKPDGMSDRIWRANVERLGFVLGGDWLMGLRSLKAVLSVVGDEGRVLDGYVYRRKDCAAGVPNCGCSWIQRSMTGRLL